MGVTGLSPPPWLRGHRRNGEALETEMSEALVGQLLSDLSWDHRAQGLRRYVHAVSVEDHKQHLSEFYCQTVKQEMGLLTE